MPLRIATRNSQLALVQANWVKQQLETKHPLLRCELVPMTTTGDRELSMPLATIGGKGLFLKELEQALLEHRADIAVHSLKDVTVDLPPGLCLTSYCQRGEARDVLVSSNNISFNALPQGAHLGTASLRRQALARALRPDLNISPVRGNLQTRLKQLDQGHFDALILAGAGLLRLNLKERCGFFLSAAQFLPAVGQGILAIECRTDDSSSINYCQSLDDPTTRTAAICERAFNQHLQGGCQVPIAGYAECEDDTIYLRGLVASPDGKTLLKSECHGSRDTAVNLGKQLAQNLIEQGADTILEAVYANHGQT